MLAVAKGVSWWHNLVINLATGDGGYVAREGACT